MESECLKTFIHSSCSSCNSTAFSRFSDSLDCGLARPLRNLRNASNMSGQYSQQQLNDMSSSSNNHGLIQVHSGQPTDEYTALSVLSPIDATRKWNYQIHYVPVSMEHVLQWQHRSTGSWVLRRSCMMVIASGSHRVWH